MASTELGKPSIGSKNDLEPVSGTNSRHLRDRSKSKRDSPKKSKKSTTKSRKSVRRKKMSYLDVPVEENKKSVKAKLLKMGDSEKLNSESTEAQLNSELLINQDTLKINSNASNHNINIERGIDPVATEPKDTRKTTRVLRTPKKSKSSSAPPLNPEEEKLKDVSNQLSSFTESKGTIVSQKAPKSNETEINTLLSTLKQEEFTDENPSKELNRQELPKSDKKSNHTQSPQKETYQDSTQTDPTIQVLPSAEKHFLDSDISYDDISVSSSPIRKEIALPRQKLPISTTVTDAHFPSFAFTPTKNRKMVGFSDDIECFSSPVSSSPMKILGPLKSILKPRIDELKSTEYRRDFKISQFWVSGSIVQLPTGSEENLLLINRAMSDLSEDQFAFKFEAYTSLNNIVKLNSISDNITWFSPITVELFKFVFRDISDSIDFKNPFATRTVVQALKLASFFCITEKLNVLIPVNLATAFILRCCKMINKPEISKSMAAMLLQLLRDQNLSSKVINLRTGEFILNAILNMSTFSSVTIITERINTLSEYVKKNFAILLKHLGIWLGFLFVNLTDTVSILNVRIVEAASQLLSEICKKFFGDKAFTYALMQMLYQPLSTVFDGIPSQSQSQIDEDSLRRDPKLLDYFCSKLKKLAQTDNVSTVMDIWFHFTLLITSTGKEESIEKWEGMKLWIEVFKECFASSKPHSKASAVKAWRSIVYSCLQSLNAAGDFSADRKKFTLTIYPFLCTNSPPKNVEVVHSMHSLFLASLNAFISSVVASNKINYLQVDEIWNRLIEPIFKIFYFSKDSTEECSRLGAELINVLISNNKSAAPPDLFRCLKPNLVLLLEVNSLPSLWISHRISLIEPYLLKSFEVSVLEDCRKIEIFINYLNCLRVTASRDFKKGEKYLPTLTGIPLLVRTLFDNLKTTESNDAIFDLLIRMNDALGIGSLIDDSEFSKNSCYTIVEKILSQENVTDKRLTDLCKFISNTLGFKLQLPFYQDLLSFRNECLKDFVLQKLKDRSLARIDPREYQYFGNILKELSTGEIAHKMVVQLISYVLNPVSEKRPAKAIESLKIETWSTELFCHALLTMIESKSKMPSLHLQSIIKYLLSYRFTNADEVENLKLIRNICESNHKVELLKHASIISKFLQVTYLRFTELRDEIKEISVKIAEFLPAEDPEASFYKNLQDLLDQDPATLENSADTLMIEQIGSVNHGISPDVSMNSDISNAETRELRSGVSALKSISSQGSLLESLMENGNGQLGVLRMRETSQKIGSLIPKTPLNVSDISADENKENVYPDVSIMMSRSASAEEQNSVSYHQEKGDINGVNNVEQSCESQSIGRSGNSRSKKGTVLGSDVKSPFESPKRKLLAHEIKSTAKRQKIETANITLNVQVDSDPLLDQESTFSNGNANEEILKDGDNSSISSLSDVDDNFEDSDIEKEFLSLLQLGDESLKKKTTVVDRVSDTAEIAGEKTEKTERNVRSLAVDESEEESPLVEKIDKVNAHTRYSKLLVGMNEELDVEELNEEEKRNLEDHLLRLVMKLRQLH